MLMAIQETDVDVIASLIPFPSQRTEAQRADATEEPRTAVDQAARDSTQVRISPLGHLLSATSEGKDASKNRDIDNSNLPDNIKETLKQIREIQQKLREQRQKLAAILANQDLSPEEKEAQLRQVQAAISTLSNILSACMDLLRKAMMEAKLTRDQQATVAGLVTKFS